MNADADIQVWLETAAKAQTSVITPHVQTNADRELRYRITTIQQGRAGRSSIGQSGSVKLKEDDPTPLSRLTIRRTAGDICHIRLVLSAADEPERRYEFECP